MQKVFSKVAIILSIVCILTLVSPIAVYATLDELLQDGTTTTSGDDTTTTDDGSGTPESMSEYLHGYNPITADNMRQASKLASPMASAIGTGTGIILILVSALIFLVTAADLLYIAVPPVRSFLNPEQPAQGGGMGMGMGGMGMGGMGMRGMGMGMGGMGMGGQQASPVSSIRWVSDEAVAALTMAGASQQPAGGGGMGMGGMGMMGMGGMGMGGMQAQPQASPKSAILIYLRKRMFFIIVFGICTIILMSSVLLDCGVNLAQLLIRVFGNVNENISNVNV